MQKKILSARGLGITGKAEGVALWPLWIFTYATGRAGDPTQAAAGAQAPSAPPVFRGV